MIELHNMPPVDDDVTRALPHALGAEKSVLSSMLQYPVECIPLAIEEGLADGHFYLPSHQILFAELVARFESNEEVELVSLVQGLLDKGKLDAVGGPGAIHEIYTYTPGTGHFRHHVAILRKKYTLRSLIQMSAETIASAYDQPDEAEKLLDQTETRIMAIRETGALSTEEPLRSVVNRTVERIQAIIEHVEEASGITTGFAGLDHLGAFLRPAEMFVVAARPSMGKTAFMMNVVEAMAVVGQRNTLVFSAEMSKDALVQRTICSRAKFPLGAIQKGEKEPSKGDLLRLQRAAIEIASAPLRIHDKTQITINEIRAIARRCHRERPLELVAIDYLQYLHSTSKQASGSREREVAEISAGVKALAKELGIPVILLAQLNRDAEKRTGASHGIPRMSDLRESGAVEQDADLIGLLYREDYYAQGEQKEACAGKAKIILAKHRNGETGDVPLTFIAPFTRFEDGYPEPELPNQPAPQSRYDDER